MTVKQLKQTNYRECICFDLRRTTRLVTQLYDSAFNSTGLRSTQFPILVMLLFGRKTLKQLANGLNLEHSTLVRGIRHLVNAGWVTLEPGKDRRTRIAALTPLGIEKIEESAPLWRKTQDSLIDKLGEEKFRKLQGHLKAIRQILLEEE